jgi:hypothetical protein
MLDLGLEGTFGHDRASSELVLADIGEDLLQRGHEGLPLLLGDAAEHARLGRGHVGPEPVEGRAALSVIATRVPRLSCASASRRTSPSATSPSSARVSVDCSTTA